MLRRQASHSRRPGSETVGRTSPHGWRAPRRVAGDGRQGAPLDLDQVSVAADDALVMRSGERAAGAWRWPRVSPAAARGAAALAGVAMVTVTLWLAFTSDHLEKPYAAGVYWSYLTAVSMAIGLDWWLRRPASRFG